MEAESSILTKQLFTQVWKSLKHQLEANYSDLDTFHVQLKDEIITDSVIAKFNSNVVERDAIDILDSIIVEVKYYTSNLAPKELMRELNYCHYSMLLCHWEHQIPFVFNIKAREMFKNNMDNMGNISFSLTNSSQLMMKLMRTIDFQPISVTDELEQLSKSSKYRKKKKRQQGYPIQFFSFSESDTQGWNL